LTSTRTVVCMRYWISAVAAQLWAPKMLTGPPLMVIHKNVFGVMLHL